jgi:NodT family efflux transporter outer membrane factor (OMF) lipoprotein
MGEHIRGIARARIGGRLALFAALATAGCTVGPNFHSPAPPPATSYLPGGAPAPAIGAPGPDGTAQRLVAGAAVDSHWWTLFKSPALDALEDEAVRHNADLAAARAALRQAHELRLAQRAVGFPSIGASASALRQKNSETLASPLFSNAQRYTLYAAQLEATYVLDLFGAQRRLVEAAAAQEELQRFQVEAAWLALTSNVASTALQIAALKSQIAAANAAVAADRRIVDITRHMVALGETSSADLAAAEAALEQAEQGVPPLQKQVGQLNDQLAILVGRTPAEMEAPRLDLAEVRLPADLPLSLPSALVRQRPDIRAAEANLHIASAQLGVAIAARLPSLTLNGNLGGNSTAIGTLFSNSNSLWSISGSVTQPVFDFGALRHRQRAAEAALDQAKEQYRAAVLAGFQNTADVLQAIAVDAETLRHATLARDAAARSADIARAQLAKGEAGALPALTAEAADQQSEQVLVQARAARYADTVALLQALGGGWWNGPQASGEAHR